MTFRPTLTFTHSAMSAQCADSIRSYMRAVASNVRHANGQHVAREEAIIMTTAVFTLFVASGLCLTFAAITAIYAIRVLEKARQFLLFAWDLLLRREHEYGYSAAQENYRREGTE